MNAIQRLVAPVKQHIVKSDQTVFLPSDFADDLTQQDFALVIEELVERGVIVPVGEGLFARVRKNTLTGELMLDAAGGFTEVCQDSLTRLGVEWQPCRAEEVYSAGDSDQIPARAIFRVVGGYYPEISFKKFRIRYET